MVLGVLGFGSEEAGMWGIVWGVLNGCKWRVEGEEKEKRFFFFLFSVDSDDWIFVVRRMLWSCCLRGCVLGLHHGTSMVEL